MRSKKEKAPTAQTAGASADNPHQKANRMNSVATVSEPDNLPVIEWKGVRVVTTETLAKGYGTDEANIRKNLSVNADRFIEGVHYFKLTGSELREFKSYVTESNLVDKRAPHITLWTEKGAARMSKIVDTDEAWAFFEKLEDSYFRPQVSGPALPMTYEEALSDLLAKVKENRVLEQQRDRAIKEKAWIADKREVTAMCTASKEKRRADALAEQLGEGRKFAAILPVERKTGKKYGWYPLRKWCMANGAQPKEIEDKRYGTVKSWPAAAWLEAYGVDLRELF